MSTLIVRRVNADLQDTWRKYAILVDDEIVGNIGNAAEVQIAIAPGKHVVQLKIDWCSSPKLDIDVSVGERQLLECGPTALVPREFPYRRLLGIFMHITFNRGQYLWLRHVVNLD